MTVRIRPAVPSDAEACGRIIYELSTGSQSGTASHRIFRPLKPVLDWHGR
ncbi:hypothetical protein [Chelativorans salis]|uniref:Acetyltransferase n=1 Tax=Chelativorans salis TaxID=2978478 RepID=A0ABT2LVZ6_9HYPH|nr:hypothetical protein [Chelativorans sp. EGI FJ00035]MCT7378695.1 hypothetical protein [Chelativorans sp. EGI FJ00035]